MTSENTPHGEPDHRLPPAPYRNDGSIFHGSSFVSQTGHNGISVWFGPSDTIRPTVSFQVYVTYDVGSFEPAVVRPLATSIWRECAPRPDAQHRPLRLDIVLLGDIGRFTRIATCIQHYRQTADLAARTPLDPGADPLHSHPFTQLAPAYGRAGAVYNGFLIVVPSPMFREVKGLGLLFFDPAPAPTMPQREHVWLYPARPPTAAPGENLWDWELSAVWRSMEVVEPWTLEYYAQLEDAGFSAAGGAEGSGLEDVGGEGEA